MNPVEEPIDCPPVVEPDRANLASLVSEMSRDLTEAKKAAESAQAAAEVERSSLKAALDRSCTTVLQLTAKNAEEKSATRRLCGQQVQLVKVLRALFDAASEGQHDMPIGARRGAVVKALFHAKEVLALLEVPFG